jgi:hypothetical protein
VRARTGAGIPPSGEAPRQNPPAAPELPVRWRRDRRNWPPAWVEYLAGSLREEQTINRRKIVQCREELLARDLDTL